MKNNIITKIWNIRGMLDKAVQNQDRELANKAQEKFNKIYETELYHKSFAIATVNSLYTDIEELCLDRNYNFAILACRFSAIKKDLIDVEANTETPIQFVSVLDLIWYTRGLYDRFMEYINGKEDLEDEQCILADGIVYNLNQCCDYLDQLVGTIEDVYNKHVIIKLLEDFKQNYREYLTGKEAGYLVE